MKGTENKKWLIISGGIILSISIFTIFILDLKMPYNKSRYNDSGSLFLNLFLIPIIVAPILEEFQFRGFLANSKVTNILFLVLTLVSLIYFEFHFFIIILVIIIYTLYILYKFRSSQIILNILIIVSAIHFTVMHYFAEEIFTFPIIPFMAIQFGAALILSWIVYNKSLLTSILFHSTWNFTFIIILIINIQFVDEDVYTIRNDKYQFTWAKTPVFGSNKSHFKYDGCTIKCTNMTLQDILEFADVGLYDSFAAISPYLKYNISISSKDANCRTSVNGHLIEALEKENLIYRLDSL